MLLDIEIFVENVPRGQNTWKMAANNICLHFSVARII